MNQKTCSRPTCDNSLHRGKLYCGRSCAARDRPRLRLLKQSPVPDDIVELVREVAGDKSGIVLDSIADVIKLASNELEVNVSKTSSEVRTQGDWVLRWTDGEELRPTDRLSFARISAMDKSGVIQFALMMKLAQLMLVFRDQRSHRFTSSDEELAKVVSAAMEHVLPRMMYNLMESALRTGSGLAELVWGNVTKHQIGLGKNRGGKKFTVIADSKIVDPETIKAIKRTKKGKFDGFIQTAIRAEGDESEIPVELENAFILTYQERYRNKWGISLYQAMYPLWFWYQIILRAMVRYMERMGTPVAVAWAPANKVVRKPGSTDTIDAMDLGLQIAVQVGKSSAVVMPSDVDNSGNKMWDLGYLTADERAQPFTDVLEKMTVMILRAALLADRSLTAGEIGAFNIGEIHDIANSIHNQMVIMLFVEQFNRHISPRLAKFNRGNNAPPLFLEVMNIDLRIRDMMQKLMAVAGNIPAAQEAMGRMDYVTMAELSGVPIISQAEHERNKKKLEKEGLERQEKQIEMQQKAKMGTDEAPFKANVEKGAESRAKDVAKGVAGGSAGQAQAQGAKEKLEEQIAEFVRLLMQDDTSASIIVTEEEIQLKFNPSQPRDNRGRFGSGGGGGGGGSSKKKEKEKKAEGKERKSKKSSGKGGKSSGGGIIAGAKPWIAAYAVGSILGMLDTTNKIIADAATSLYGVGASIFNGDADTKNGELNTNPERFINGDYPGEGSAAAGSAMSTLATDPTHEEALGVLAEELDISVEEAQAQMELVNKYREAAELGDPATLDPDNEHWGSREQMIFGDVVSMNLDPSLMPAFAAMLSPTGGITGPGAIDIGHLIPELVASEDVIGVHSAVHDAAGYLLNNFGIGPGYEYAGNGILSSDSPISGQVSGVAFWGELMKGMA